MMNIKWPDREQS